MDTAATTSACWSTRAGGGGARASDAGRLKQALRICVYRSCEEAAELGWGPHSENHRIKYFLNSLKKKKKKKKTGKEKF